MILVIALLLLGSCFNFPLSIGYESPSQISYTMVNELELYQGLKIAVVSSQTKPSLVKNSDKELLHLSTDYAELFVQNKKDWAMFQNYDYINTIVEQFEGNATLINREHNSKEALELSLSFLKIDLILNYIDDYDWVVWMDMDTVIVDFQSFQIEDFIRHALVSRPQVDLILEGSEDYKAYNGNALKSGLILLRSSLWTKRLLLQLRELLSDEELLSMVKRKVETPGTSILDDSLTYLLNSYDSHSYSFSEPHIFLMHLQDRWNQQFVYLPKIGLLHFSGCTIKNERCLEVFHKAITHILKKEQFYVYLAAPYVQHIYNIFAGIYVLFALDRLIHILGCYFVSRSKRKNLKKVNLPDPCEKPVPVLSFPVVVVQLPMYNESSCCQTIIDSACRLQWPSSRLIVQVVDDSTNEETKDLINERVRHWQCIGINVNVERRIHREGFKAGAMNEAMDKFPDEAEYIAIFDADFLPCPDFLMKTVPYLMADQMVAFVQTRWVYTNSKESLLTRMQEISLNFHFNCEQEMRFRCNKFFNFNGTAGVWRKRAIDDSGGWETDTLVEDMDLSLRAFANGWKFIYLHDVKVLNEIPPTFSAYRGQQHRWTSGPMQVLKKAFRTVYHSTHLSLTDKIFCIWFFLRNYVHIINFLYFLILIPLMIWVPRVTLYEWAVVYLPCAISMTNVLFTPREVFSVVHYVLFENAMCLYKTGALICGVLNIGKAKQWVVTPKYARKTVIHEGREEIPSLLNDDEEMNMTGIPEKKMFVHVSTSSSPTKSLKSESTNSEGSLNALATPPELNIYSDEEREVAGGVSEEVIKDLKFPFTPAPTPKRFPSLLFYPTDEPVVKVKVIDKEKPSVSATRRVIPLSKAYQFSLWFKPNIQLHYKECLMATFLLVCAYYGFLMRQNGIASFCLLNSIAYYTLGISYIGRSG